MKNTKIRDIYFESCPFTELFNNCPKKVRERLEREYDNDLSKIEALAYDVVIESTKINNENYLRWKELKEAMGEIDREPTVSSNVRRKAYKGTRSSRVRKNNSIASSNKKTHKKRSPKK